MIFRSKAKKEITEITITTCVKKIAQINGILSKLHHYVPQKTQTHKNLNIPYWPLIHCPLMTLISTSWRIKGQRKKGLWIKSHVLQTQRFIPLWHLYVLLKANLMFIMQTERLNTSKSQLLEDTFLWTFFCGNHFSDS